MTLTDWSQDGQYLTYFSTDLTGGGLYAVPLAGERKPIEVLRNKSQNTGPRLSPDNRFMAFVSNSSGRNEVYVVPFDPKAAAGTAPTPIPDLGSGRHGHGVLAQGRQGAVLPGRRPQHHVGRGRHGRNAVRQARVALPSRRRTSCRAWRRA